MTTKTKALKLLQESRAQLAYLGDDKHTNELVSQIDAVLAQPEQETCKGCNGNGMVGNILDTVVCPFCKGSGVEAQPEQRSVSEQQEPVAWKLESGQAIWFERTDPEAASALPPDVTMTPLYTTPPQRKPLTFEQIDTAIDRMDLNSLDWAGELHKLVRAIEAAHGIKE